MKGPASGMKLSDETVIDSFVFSAAAGPDVSAVEVRPHADAGDAIPQVRLVNCIVNGRMSTGEGGAVINDGGDVWLVHCAISGNGGATVDGIANRRGKLHLMNSVLWNTKSGKLQELGGETGEGNLEVVNSVLRGAEGTWGSDPKLTLDGHLTKASQACMGHGNADMGVPVDLHGVNRYEKVPISVDLGV